jgi:GAF domain-containing protein
MEPIKESGEALETLSVTAGHDLAEDLRQLAERVQEEIPHCIAISISLRDSDLTFTFTSTVDDLRLVDAAQYLHDGPCQVAAYQGEVVDVQDILDEDRWQTFAQASARLGVRSSLSLPLHSRGILYGSVNLYADSEAAFTGHEHQIAATLGTHAAEAVANADLSMASMERARQAPSMIEAVDTVNTAVGILAERDAVPPDEARRRLLDAASRAGINAADLARLIVAPERGG